MPIAASAVAISMPCATMPPMRASSPAPSACATSGPTAVRTPWKIRTIVKKSVAPRPPAAKASPPSRPIIAALMKPISTCESCAPASGRAMRASPSARRRTRYRRSPASGSGTVRSGARRDAHRAAEGAHRLFDDLAAVEPRLVILQARRIVVDEAVGQHHRTHLEAVLEQPGIREMVQHVAGEAADGAFLDGDQHLVLARQALDQRAVERLGEARIGDSDGDAVGFELLRRFEAFLEPRAETEQRDRGAFLDDPPAADMEDVAALG